MTERTAPATATGRPLDGHVRRVLDAAAVPVATLDAEGHLVTVSPAFARVCGRAPGELVGLHVTALCPGRDQAEVLASFVHLVGGVSEIEQAELRVVGADGRVRVLRVTLGALPDDDGRAERVLAVATDLTEERRQDRRRRQASVEAARAAVRDPDTGLPNERGLGLLLASAVRRSARSGAPFALLRCEVANLDDLEHRHGPAAARAALALVAERLSQRLRGSDSVTRTGTGTYSVVAEDLGDVQDAAGVAYRLLASVVEPIRVAGPSEDGEAVDVALTIGIAVGDGGASPTRILDDAATAVEEALRDGAGGFRMLDGRAGAPLGARS
jgi:PAS domain S-box-containing protein/diguanylate cyclase (GGDEF)-like protein